MILTSVLLISVVINFGKIVAIEKLEFFKKLGRPHCYSTKVAMSILEQVSTCLFYCPNKLQCGMIKASDVQSNKQNLVLYLNKICLHTLNTNYKNESY